MPVARDEDGAHCYVVFRCKSVRLRLCNWIYFVIFDTIAMITIFCTVVLSVIQGIALNIGVLPFLKGRVLHYESIFFDKIKSLNPTLISNAQVAIKAQGQ
jgi:F420-0:gamma-glutamyl ligase-like protein